MTRRAAALGSALFFLAAPGTVAGLLPWLLTGWRRSAPAGWWGWVATVVGAVLVLAGLTVVASAFVRFVREGSGTPAPIAETDRLVVGGVYRHVRNPMYVAVVSCILGQALLFASMPVLVYAIVAWTTMAAFVRGYEEPRLRERFGAAYDDYQLAVPAWLPRLRPWEPDIRGG